MTGPSILLCTCGDEVLRHVLERNRGRTVCQRRGCRCIRFVEAPFERQQMPLFEESHGS